MDRILFLPFSSQPKKKMYLQFYCHVWVYFFLGPSAWRDCLIHWFGANVIICRLFLKVLTKSKKGDQWCAPLSSEVVISEFLAGYVTRNPNPEVRISHRKVRGTSISTILQFSMASPFYPIWNESCTWHCLLSTYKITITFVSLKSHIYSILQRLRIWPMTTINMLIMLFSDLQLEDCQSKWNSDLWGKGKFPKFLGSYAP